MSNLYKKTYVETVELVKENCPTLRHYIVWRAGTQTITPQTEDEVATLIDAQSEDFDDIFDFADFSEVEFDSTWDGCSEDLVSDDDPEYADETRDKYYDDEELNDEYFSIVEYLEEAEGYEPIEWYNQIEGPIRVELIEE